MKGQRPLALVVLKSGTEQVDSEELKREIVQDVRSQIGPVASFKEVRVVKRLPKTRSGKILRDLLRKIADGETYKMPSTIHDASIVPELEELFELK